jgi:pyridoxamine 5'-phosphate oxidase
MSTDPHVLFEEWLSDAHASEINDPTAMALATADAEGRPSVRMVLLKIHDTRGFTLHTNLESQKGREIAVNPDVALLFHWKSLRRQVRVEGRVEQVSDEEADAYFATRDLRSRIGAWASSQSRPLESRNEFERRYVEVETQYQGRDVPRPSYWTGLRVVPRRMEFWSDRPYRLHERRLFTLAGGVWSEGLLYP